MPDAENPEWTAERFARAKRFHELSPGPQAKLSAIQETSRKKRGPQKTPTKQQVTMRLSQDVLTTLRAGGRGWQTLVDDTLRAQFVRPR